LIDWFFCGEDAAFFGDSFFGDSFLGAMGGAGTKAAGFLSLVAIGAFYF